MREQGHRGAPYQGLLVRWEGAWPMSSAIVPYGQVSRVPSKRNKALAIVEGEALVSAHKVKAVQLVGMAALQGVAQLSMTQAECAKLAPDAELRLAAIGDAATNAMQMVLLRLGMEL